MEDYLTKPIYIAHVDENDSVIGQVERWKAHEEGILHRAFTVAALFDGKIICQHRKHPVFDAVFDLTSSSHPKYINDQLQTNEVAIIETLEREWNIKPDSIKNLTNKGSVIYKTKDQYSKYIEHEFCYLYTCEVNTLPQVGWDVAYGFSLQKVEDLKKTDTRFYSYLASWVQEFLQKGLL